MNELTSSSDSYISVFFFLFGAGALTLKTPSNTAYAQVNKIINRKNFFINLFYINI